MFKVTNGDTVKRSCSCLGLHNYIITSLHRRDQLSPRVETHLSDFTTRQVLSLRSLIGLEGVGANIRLKNNTSPFHRVTLNMAYVDPFRPLCHPDINTMK